MQQTATTNPVQEMISMLGQYNLLSQLQREIIIDEAISTIDCTPQEQESAYQQFMQANQLGDREDGTLFQPDTAQCSPQGELSNASVQTKQQVVSMLTRKLKIQKFKQATFESKVHSYFIGRKSQLDKVVYSRIINQDQGVTQELYFRLLEAEETFTELARKYSQDSKACVDGIVGPVAVSSLNPHIAQHLLSSKPGQVLPPICCQNVYVIVRLERTIPAVLDASMRHQLCHELFESWLAQQCSDRRYQELMWQKLNALGN